MREDLLTTIHEHITHKVYPGASLALFSQGVWQEWYLGTQDGRRPVMPGLVYDLASVSKVVGVGQLVIRLICEGVLELDAPLSQYYPDFVREEVTIRQLLTHTSGLDPYIPNREQLEARELRAALHHLSVTDDRSFHYTDVNFLLLGFLLEHLTGKDLGTLCREQIFRPLGMERTSFGPVEGAVPTSRWGLAGVVHDPKARVLGCHAGSAGLFSTVADLQVFLEWCLKEEGFPLCQDYGFDPKRERSLAWDKKGEWLSHTGYTGTFISYNRFSQQAVIFLSNRTFEKDDRPQWKKDRNFLIKQIWKTLAQETFENKESLT